MKTELLHVVRLTSLVVWYLPAFIPIATLFDDPEVSSRRAESPIAALLFDDDVKFRRLFPPKATLRVLDVAKRSASAPNAVLSVPVAELKALSPNAVDVMAPELPLPNRNPLTVMSADVLTAPAVAEVNETVPDAVIVPEETPPGVLIASALESETTNFPAGIRVCVVLVFPMTVVFDPSPRAFSPPITT
jgi:hypothetical protein